MAVLKLKVTIVPIQTSPKGHETLLYQGFNGYSTFILGPMIAWQTIVPHDHGEGRGRQKTAENGRFWLDYVWIFESFSPDFTANFQPPECSELPVMC